MWLKLCSSEKTLSPLTDVFEFSQEDCNIESAHKVIYIFVLKLVYNHHKSYTFPQLRQMKD